MAGNLKEPNSISEVYAIINHRLISALMFHSQMTEYFYFLGLNGYGRMHEYQYFDESKERQSLNRYYIEHHNKLIEGLQVENAAAIPDDWYTANRLNMGKGTTQKAIENGFADYRAWETETKALYEHCAAFLLGIEAVTDTAYVRRLAEGVTAELKMIEDEILQLIKSGYDMPYIIEKQDAMEKYYSAKLSKLFKE